MGRPHQIPCESFELRVLLGSFISCGLLSFLFMLYCWEAKYGIQWDV